MMERFRSILYLDDMRVPTLHGVDLVQNYAEFTEYLDDKGMPDLISFDHDLAREHYPSGPNEAGQEISYSTYREKTGLDCARFIIENGLALRYWAVHSANVQGRINIERALRRYRRQGEVPGLKVPFVIRQAEVKSQQITIPSLQCKKTGVPADRRFSNTSLLQFQEDISLEGWEESLLEGLTRR